MPDLRQWATGPRGHELRLDCGLVLLEWHEPNCQWCVTCEALGVHCLLLCRDLEGSKSEALRMLLAYVRLAEAELAQYVEAN